MKQTQKMIFWLATIFLTCFLSFIVLRNIQITQFKEREEVENENIKIKNDITAIHNERLKNVDVEVLNNGVKNGIVNYDDKSVLDLK